MNVIQQQTKMKFLFGEKPILKMAKEPPAPKNDKKKRKKKPIPAAIREACWQKRCGRVFEHKCLTPWCPNIITVFDFQAGHDIPESKGGPTTVENLYPICSRCNQSMGDRFTFQQWSALHQPQTEPQKETIVVAPPQPRSKFARFFQCFHISS
jgi:hypothetical protein